jgi:tetratricopeptide (TPR) repeat protein
LGLLSLIKPLRKYEDYLYRANTYQHLRLRNKAIQIMESAITQPNFIKEEIASGLFYLGILYTKDKDYGKAAYCYNRGLELMKDKNFSYSSNFKNVIKTFLKNDDKERAAYWLNNLLERQNYDKKYKRLTSLKGKFSK